jgi:hypothetical protein
VVVFPVDKTRKREEYSWKKSKDEMHSWQVCDLAPVSSKLARSKLILHYDYVLPISEQEELSDRGERFSLSDRGERLSTSIA